MDIKNSMLLANMMSKSGGGAKTLNLVSVGGATYDSDYIYTNDGSLKYFETPNKIVYDMTDNFTIKVKFLIENTNNNGVFRAYDLNVWNGEVSLYSDNSFRLFVLATQIFYGNITNNIWVNLLIENIKNENKVLVYMKDENGYIYKDNYITYSSSTDLTGKYKFGNFNDTYKLNGKIDFKETDIIINGKSVLWI